MSNVFLVDTSEKPLDPVHPGYARLLLKQGRAAVFKRFPFTLILKIEIKEPEVQPLRIKLDPGSCTTGIAIVNDATGAVVFAAELTHRGHQIKEDLHSRRVVRAARRARKARWSNRRNQKKGWLPPSLESRSANVMTRVQRLSLFERLKGTGLPVETGSGGLTKYNRTTRELPKAHWLDAANVGKSTPEPLHIKQIVPWLITAHGHGCRQMCLMDRFGFPRTQPKTSKKVKGFQTGDIVKAVVTSGTKIGTYVGRVAVRATGSFNLTTKQGTVQGISHHFCTPRHKCDGYSYGHGVFPTHPSPKKGTPVSSPA